MEKETGKSLGEKSASQTGNVEIIMTIILTIYIICHFKNESFQYKQSALLAKGKKGNQVGRKYF